MSESWVTRSKIEHLEREISILRGHVEKILRILQKMPEDEELPQDSRGYPYPYTNKLEYEFNKRVAHLFK